MRRMQKVQKGPEPNPSYGLVGLSGTGQLYNLTEPAARPAAALCLSCCHEATEYSRSRTRPISADRRRAGAAGAKHRKQVNNLKFYQVAVSSCYPIPKKFAHHHSSAPGQARTVVASVRPGAAELARPARWRARAWQLMVAL